MEHRDDQNFLKKIKDDCGMQKEAASLNKLINKTGLQPVSRPVEQCQYLKSKLDLE